MVSNRARVTCQAVAASAWPQFGGGARRQTNESARAQAGKCEPGTGSALQARRSPAVEKRDRSVEVVDLDQPRDICAAEAELARCPQNVRDRRGRADMERRPVVSSRSKRATVPERDREWTLAKGSL
jgi:hypothetical protein